MLYPCRALNFLQLLDKLQKRDGHIAACKKWFKHCKRIALHIMCFVLNVYETNLEL